MKGCGIEGRQHIPFTIFRTISLDEGVSLLRAFSRRDRFALDLVPADKRGTGSRKWYSHKLFPDRSAIDGPRQGSIKRLEAADLWVW